MKRSFRSAAWGLGATLLAAAIGCTTTQPGLLPSTASLVDDMKPVEGPARLARVLRRLEAAGWVERLPAGLALTPAGAGALERTGSRQLAHPPT